MTYSPNNPFARPAADPQEVTEPTHDAREVVTGIPFHDRPGQDENAPFTDDDTGRVNWTHTDDLEAAYTGPGTDNGKREDFPVGVLPPNWPAWTTAQAALARVASLADDLLERGERVTREVNGGLVESFDWTTDLAVKYLQAVRDAEVALAAARKEARYAKNYEDPDTGLGFQKLVRDRMGKDFVNQVAAATRRYRASLETTAAPLPVVSGTAQDLQWTIQDYLPRGGAALLVGTQKEDTAAALAAAVATGGDFDGREIMVSDVVVIDAETPDALLFQRYAAVLEAGSTVLGFRGRAKELDVREEAVRRWLARVIPEGALVIVDSLPTLLGVLDVSDMAADAGGYLAGWTSLVVECKAAGLVMLHDTPQGKPYQARGHGSITQWSDTVWAAHDERVMVDGRPLRAGAAPDPAKPEREGGAARRTTTADERRADLLDAVRAIPGRTTTQVADAAGIPLSTADRILKKMEAEGVLETSKGARGKTTFWFPKAT